ncbi:MAG TPA: hypothetical protein PKL06_02655 [Chitinophagales bacterium]|mgnify:CR=1 FL=1|nr:hypothetical protein [Chitinophagales bacterium]
MKKFPILSMSMILAVAISSCDRAEEPLLTDADPSSAKTTAEATKTFDDVAVMTEEAVIQYIENPEYDTYTFGECVTLIVDSVNTKITFDLGNAGCTGLDGITRKGKIIADYNGMPREAGSTLSITLENFSVDGYRVSGNFTYNAIAENASGDLELAYSVSDGEYIEPDGDVLTFSCFRTFTWTAGMASENLYDDVFTTSGGFTAGLNGDIYTGETKEEIVLASTCWADGIYYPTSGTWELIFPDGIYRAIDYGSGDCDKTVVVTIGSRDYTYQLP